MLRSFFFYFLSITLLTSCASPSPLRQAVLSNDYTKAKQLIDDGESIYKQPFDDSGPMSYLGKNQFEMAKVFIDAGYNLNEDEHKSNFEDLLCAASEDSHYLTATVKQWTGSNSTLANQLQECLIFLAVDNRVVALDLISNSKKATRIKNIVQLGANIDTKVDVMRRNLPKDKEYILEATAYSNPQLVETLIDLGADLALGGESFSKWAIDNNNNPSYVSALNKNPSYVSALNKKELKEQKLALLEKKQQTLEKLAKKKQELLIASKATSPYDKKITEYKLKMERERQNLINESYFDDPQLQLLAKSYIEAESMCQFLIKEQFERRNFSCGFMTGGRYRQYGKSKKCKKLWPQIKSLLIKDERKFCAMQRRSRNALEQVLGAKYKWKGNIINHMIQYRLTSSQLRRQFTYTTIDLDSMKEEAKAAQEQGYEDNYKAAWNGVLRKLETIGQPSDTHKVISRSFEKANRTADRILSSIESNQKFSSSQPQVQQLESHYNSLIDDYENSAEGKALKRKSEQQRIEQNKAINQQVAKLDAEKACIEKDGKFNDLNNHCVINAFENINSKRRGKTSTEKTKECKAIDQRGYNLEKVPKKYCNYMFDKNTRFIHQAYENVDAFLAESSTEKGAQRTLKLSLINKARKHCVGDGYTNAFHLRTYEMSEVVLLVKNCKSYNRMTTKFHLCEGSAEFICGKLQ